MKSCPICKAVMFDDMVTCYKCMNESFASLNELPLIDPIYDDFDLDEPPLAPTRPLYGDEIIRIEIPVQALRRAVCQPDARC